MKFNPRLKGELANFYEYVIIVEGKKDVNLLLSLGFKRVYALHETGIPIRAKIEEILKKLDKRDKICILTDFDKKGKSLYMLVKPIFLELGAKLDSTFRGLLLKSNMSHIEELRDFINKATNDNQVERNWEVR